MKKKKWEKPKLIVIIRGDRQERVLVACKSQFNGGGPTNIYYGCDILPDCDHVYELCSANAPS